MEVLTEHAPLAKVISAIPKRAQRGLFSEDITWTSLDADDAFIALGSNIGTVFLYHRNTGQFDRLTCKTKAEIVSCVKIQSGHDDVVAAGTASGMVCIFQLPSQLPGRNTELQMYVVSHSHHSPVWSLAWNSNGMKLFSGDEDGVVICTEIDYANEESKSFHVCKEPHRIVQLDFGYKLLLVSTSFRSFLIAASSNDITQIGTKDRKILGRFGACFLPDVPSPQDAVLFAARPGLRLWKSDTKGVVMNTFMLKNSAPEGLCNGVNLLPDIGKAQIDYEKEEMQLGRLYMYQGTLLFTYSSRSCYVIDPGLGVIVSHHRNIGSIIDVAVNDSEIFILRHGHERPIIRLAGEADSRLGLPGTYLDPLPGDSPLDILSNTAVKLSDNIVGALKNVGQKLQTVQDGHDLVSRPKLPPWGMKSGEDVQKEENSVTPDTDSAIEAKSVLNSPQEEERDIIEEESVQQHVEEDTPPGAPPIVRLSSQDLPSLEVGASGAPAMPNVPHFVIDDVEDSDDIVYSAKARKKKVKKKKKKFLPGDKDAISISSMDSSLDVNPSPTRPDSPNTLQPLYLPNANTSYQDSTDIATSVSDIKDIVELNAAVPNTNGDCLPVNELSVDSNQDSIEIHQQSHQCPQLPSSILKDLQPRRRLNSDEILDAVLNQRPLNTEVIDHDELGSPQCSAGVSVSEPIQEEADCNEEYEYEITGNDQSPYFPNYTRTARHRTMTNESEDFYKKYRSYSTTSSISFSVAKERTLSECCEDFTVDLNKTITDEKEDLHADEYKRADAWSTLPAPENLKSICVTDRHMWAADASNALYYSWLAGAGLKWKDCKTTASQIAVSPSGWIVWKLYKGCAYAATGVTVRTPFGTKWVEVAQQVSYITVDNSIAWYVKESGELRIQKNLNRDRPTFRSEIVECSENLIQVQCLNGIVWALTDTKKILVRKGINIKLDEGLAWVELPSLEPEQMPSTFCLGDKNTAWILDMVGRLWFTCDVTVDNPLGSGIWWQVSLSSYLMQDATALDFIKTMIKIPQKNLSILLHQNMDGLLTAANGLWMCPGGKTVLHVCRGSLIGHRWDSVNLNGIMKSTQWANISASGLDASYGLVWAQQPNGSIFCFPPDYTPASRIIEVNSPEAGTAFRCLIASTESTWGLSRTGQIYIRAGMATHCPQGTRWAQLDLLQLGHTRLVSMSCGLQNVWVIDKKGQVYMRIGLKPPSEMALNPAWVPVDGSTNTIGSKFIQVAVGPNDWMVWALDNKHNVYVRRGINDAMPIGTHWVYVEGASVVQVSISNHYVYALSTNGEVLVRYGITPDDVMGNYWRVAPGAFNYLSVAPDDRLYALDHEHIIQRRYIHLLERDTVLKDLVGAPPTGRSERTEDWEVI